MAAKKAAPKKAAGPYKKATHRRPVATSERRLVSELRQAIERSGLPWTVLAREAGLNHNVVTRFMAGDTDITLSNASMIAEVIGLHLTIPKGNQA